MLQIAGGIIIAYIAYIFILAILELVASEVTHYDVIRDAKKRQESEKKD